MRKKGVRHFKLRGVPKPFHLHSKANQVAAAQVKERLRKTHHVRLIQKTIISGMMYETEIWIRKR